jgi:S-adenosylmethionine:tRNA-ribosyltransferase-isomerase (queuine synthetase)
MTETDRHRALMVLASCADGLTEALLTAGHHFTRELLDGLIRDGLAGAHIEHHAASGGQPIEVTRIKITEAGQGAIGTG